LYLHLLKTIAERLFLLGPHERDRLTLLNNEPCPVDVRKLPISRMVFLSEACNLAAVPQFQLSRRAYILSTSAILHTELPPARKGKKDWRKDIPIVPIEVPRWFIAYLIVCGQLRLREIWFETGEMVNFVGLQGMRTVDVLSHLLGFEAVISGLSASQWRDISLDTLEVVDYHKTALISGQLDRFIALNPTTLTFKLDYKCGWLQGDWDGERVTSTRLEKMRVEVSCNFDPDDCDKLLDHLTTAAPNLRDLSVRVDIDECGNYSVGGEKKELATRIQEALVLVRDSTFPRLMRVMGTEVVVEFELVATMFWDGFENFRKSDHELLDFGAPVQEGGFDYSRSLAIARGEGLPDWHLSFHIQEIIDDSDYDFYDGFVGYVDNFSYSYGRDSYDGYDSDDDG